MIRKKYPIKVRKRYGTDTAREQQYHDETFRLLMKRFDDVDKDNKEIKDKLDGHILEDAKVHKVVDRQSTYWALLLFLGGPVIVGAIAWIQSLLSR